jgi:glycine cleavage system H protein
MVVAVAADCKYAPSHEWVKVDGDTATIGISDFAQVSFVHVL